MQGPASTVCQPAANTDALLLGSAELAAAYPQHGCWRKHTVQEVICRLARVVVAHEEGEWGPEGIEHGLDVPAHIDEREAACNPAQCKPPPEKLP